MEIRENIGHLELKSFAVDPNLPYHRGLDTEKAIFFARNSQSVTDFNHCLTLQTVDPYQIPNR